MSPARSFSQGDTSSELPRSPHWPTCLAPGPPQKTGQAAVHAQTARRARHHHSARKKEHTGRPQTARAGIWVQTQETSALKGGKQRNGTTPGVEREAHTRMPTHAHRAFEGGFTRSSTQLTTSLAQNVKCCTLFSPFKAQTQLESQTHLLRSEDGAERVLRRAEPVGPFGCTHPEDGSRAEAARRGEPSLSHCGQGGPTGEAKIVKA